MQSWPACAFFYPIQIVSHHTCTIILPRDIPRWHRSCARSHGARHSAPRTSICQVCLCFPLRESFTATRRTGCKLPVKSTSHRQAPTPQLDLPNHQPTRPTRPAASAPGMLILRARTTAVYPCCSSICIVVLSSLPWLPNAQPEDV